MSEVISITEGLPAYLAADRLAEELNWMGVEIWVKDWSNVGSRNTLIFGIENLPISDEAQEKIASFRKRFEEDPEFYEAVWVNALQLGSLLKSV